MQCWACGEAIKRGEVFFYDANAKEVVCRNCPKKGYPSQFLIETKRQPGCSFIRAEQDTRCWTCFKVVKKNEFYSFFPDTGAVCQSCCDVGYPEFEE